MKQGLDILRSMFSSKVLFCICSMLFFFALFDGLVTYITPVAIKDAGYSNTTLGMLLGFSSLAGAIFDFLLSKYITNTHFRRIYLLMFAAAALYPLLMLGVNSLMIFLAAMGVWGLYYDLSNFGLLDFVSRKFEESKRPVILYLINGNITTGYLVFYFVFAAGIVISMSLETAMLMYIILGFSFLFFLALLFFNRKDKIDLLPLNVTKPLSFFFEAKLWMKINKIILPLVLLTLLFSIAESFFWTLGPLMTQNMKKLQAVSDDIYNLPFDNNDPNAIYLVHESVKSVYPSDMTLLVLAVMAISMIGVLVFLRERLGKMHTAYAIFYIGSVMMAFLYFAQKDIDVVYNIMFAFGFFSFAIPILDSAYTDYINKFSAVEKELQGIRDFFVNMGYVAGPVISGILADKVGYVRAFSVLGISYLIIVLAAILLLSRSVKTEQII